MDVANQTPDEMNSTQHAWWQRGLIYQVCPRSFQDTNGDGIGDLRGITERLEYLHWLGVDALWLSPIYPSPMVDFGYDITDHKDIDPRFGTLADMDTLVAEAHHLNLKVMLDFVPNHTSDQHSWFTESRCSEENPKREWYLWVDPGENGGLPNNWRSVFGGPAWTLDEATGQYYYHAYLTEQPDLNWRNPELREAMLGVMRFWLERGVDGFRVDALRHLIKDDRLRDNPPNPDYKPSQAPFEALIPAYTVDQNETHRVIREMRRALNEYSDTSDVGGERIMVGELYLPIERLMRYYGEGGMGVQLPSNMHLIATHFEAREVAKLSTTYEAALPPGGWPNWVLGNHDRSRLASRLGPERARLAALLLLTLRGTPTLYYGDELGMCDVTIPPERVQDPYEMNVPGIGVGRDPERTPMQWDDTPNAGFCEAEATPWLPVAKNHKKVNVAALKADPDSILNFYRRLIQLRREKVALSVGEYALISADNEVLAYVRRDETQRFLVVLNFSGEPRTFTLKNDFGAASIRLTTRLDREGEGVAQSLELRPYEGVVLELNVNQDR